MYKMLSRSVIFCRLYIKKHFGVFFRFTVSKIAPWVQVARNPLLSQHQQYWVLHCSTYCSVWSGVEPLPWGARGCQPSFIQHMCTTCSTFITCTCSMNQPLFLQDYTKTRHRWRLYNTIATCAESSSRWSWCSIVLVLVITRVCGYGNAFNRILFMLQPTAG